MASVEAAINLVVRGQQRVNSLLQDINQLGAAVENLSRQPLQFDVSAPERQLTQITNAVNNANQRLGTVAEQAAKRLASGVNRSYSIFARNQDTINRLEARGATGTKAYSTAVARRDRALEAVAASQEQYNRTLQRTNGEIENNNQMLEENTRNLNQQSRNLRIIDDLSRSWLDASVAVRRYNNELEGVPSSLSAGQIRGEISLFNDLASSVRVGSEAFSQFTIASRSAGQELGNVARRRIGILAEAFSASPQARISPRGEGRSIIPGRELTRTRGEVDRLIETSRSVVPSEAGLTLMIDQLQELRALIPFVDENYGRLTTRIRELNDELNAGTGRPDPVQRQITAEIGRQADLLDRVNRANLTIAQQEVVRGRLEEAGFAVQEGNVELARQQIRGISGQITAMQSVNRQQETRNRLIEDELSLTAGRRRRIVLSDLPQEQKRSLLDRANAAQELLVSGDLEGGKRIRKELDRDRFQSERNYRSTLSLAEARQAIIDKTFSLEQDLTRVQSSGVEIAGELNKLVGIRNILQGNGVNINRQLISDQSILVDGVADFVTTEGKRIANLNRANALTDKQAKAEKDLITKGNILKGIQGKYNDLKAKGLSFGKEEADLQSLISQIDNDQYTANERNIKSLDTLIKKYASFAALKQRDLGKTKNFGTLGIDFIPITGKLPGGQVVPGSPATRKPSRGASFAMGPMAAPVDRITGPVSSIEEPKNMAGLARSAQLQLQQFRALQLSGLDVSREIAGVEKIINDIQGERIPLSENYRKNVENILGIGMDYVKLLKGQLSIDETITNTQAEFINKRNDLNKILLRYNQLKKDGVKFGDEEVELQNLVNSLAGENVAKTKQLTTELGRQVRKFQSYQGLRVQEAVAAGAFTGSSTTPEKLESQRNKLLREAFGLRDSLNTLDKKGLDTTAEREQLERQITYLKGKQGQITKDTLRQTQGDLESVRVIFDSLKTGIGELKSELVEASKATGFGKSLQDFQEGLKGSRTFFGDESPAQAIDKIIRDFNKGDLTTATRDGEGAAAAAISQAIQDPIVDAAPEGERQVRNAIQRLFDKISSILGGIGGGGAGLPPRPPVGPGGPAGPGGGDGPDSFGARLGPAEAEGVEALLSLRELKKPSKATTKRLEILSAVLKDVYVNLDPTAENAKKLNAELRKTTARLDEIVASRAPDADPLMRLTGSPRLAQGISEGLIGGAFPLLFGQGVGAAAGGGLGGFAGGFMGGSLGFGLSLVGTALGAAIDELGNKAIETGKSLRNPIEGFEQLKEANLFASKSQELYIQKLIESNNVTAASSAIQDEIIKKIGVSGYNNLIRVSQASSNLNKAWADLNVQMQALLAGPLTGLLNWMTGIAKRMGEEVRTGTKIKDVREGLSEADRREFDKQINEAYNKTLMSGGFLKSGSNSNLLKQYGEIADRFESRSNLGAVQATELAPEQINQQQLKPYQDAVDILGKRLESVDLLKNYANQLRDAAREQQDLDQQRFDLLKDYERSIADIRLSVERQVQQEVLANKQKENELFAAQGELRLQQLRNTNAELRSSQFGNEFGEQLADIVAQFTEKQLSTENEIANRRKNLELELETKRIQTEQYRIDVAKQVSQLNLSTQKQIEQIQLSVLRKNQDYDRAKFNTEKTIAVTNLEIKRLEAQQAAAMLRSQLGTVQDPIQRISLEQQAAQQTELANFVQRQKDLIKSVQPPAPISFQSASVGSSVSTAGIESAAARGRELITQIESLRTQIDALVQSGDITNINDSFMRLSDQGVKSLIDRYEDLNSLFSGDAGTKTAIDRIQKAFNDIMASETVQKSPIKEDLIGLLSLYRMLSVKNRQLAESLEFVTSKFENQLQEIDGLKGEVNSSIAGLKEYEQTLLDLTLRGLSPASDEFKKFIKNAQEIDRLNQKIEVINGFKTAATELTLSLRGLVEQFFEVGSAAEAVKAFSQEFSKKALGFVLDIGFKPVEQAMQKTMLDLASKLGFDIAPESMKQLQEISTIRTSVQSIEAQIATFIKTLTTANVETLYQQKDSIFFRVGEGEKTSVLSASKSDLAISGQAELDPFIKEAIRRKAITESQAPYARKKLTEEIRKAVPTFGQMDSQAPSSQTGGLMESQIMRDQYGNPVGRGQGGSDDQMSRQAFPLPEKHPYPNQDPDSDLPLPGSEALRKAIQLQTFPANNIETLTKDIKAIDGSASEAKDSLRQWDFELNSSSAAVKKTAADLVKENKQLDTVVPQWGKNLGAAVTGLSLASTAVIGIVGGVQNIKAGGAGNVLSGIGSILTTIGSIGMSVSGFMKPAAGNSMLGAKTGFLANANGNVFDDGQLMRFANGGVLQSPTLFNFEDAGVTKTGQAGEAGVEAVMPLKRTKDGRLGVEAELSIPFEADDDQGDTEERDGRTAASALPVPFVRAGGRTGSMTAAQMLQAAAEAGLNVPFMKGSEGGESDLSSLDSPIRFETFRVGELDVVTRKEAEEIGRRAEARGATKGAALAQKRFQNSPGTRRSSGL